MKREGLVRGQRGVWEITDKGRSNLEEPAR
jgi:hypothetical protein